MALVTTTSIVRQIESLFDGGSVAGLTDGRLIERFDDRRDPNGEAAFAALVARHGSMVLHVCRQLLNDEHHAEDAFQAVFLVLAHKSGSIRDPELLGNWLYGVAIRTARKARGRLARRRRTEEGHAMRLARSVPGIAIEPAEHRVLASEQAELLCREIDRLPMRFRQVIVLCYFEGLTIDEAARRLRCPAGTVRSRLARACDKLRRGMTHRGVTLTAALTARSASGSISSCVCDITARAPMNFAAGRGGAGAISASALTLAQEVLRSILLSNLRLTALTLAFLGAIAGGAGFVAQAPGRQADFGELSRAGKPDLLQVAAEPVEVKPEPGPSQMFVVGRVLDPQGKPVPKATTMVYANLKQPWRFARLERMAPPVIGEAISDTLGRFRLDAARTSSATHEQSTIIAIAPGYGAGWVNLDLDADRHTADIMLPPEQVIQGRLFDLQGQPVQGVAVSVGAMGRLLRDPEGDPNDFGLDGPELLRWKQAKGLPAWPLLALTDAEGRFTVRGAGQGLRVILTIDEPRFARQNINVDTDNTASSKPVMLAMQPAKTIVGRIVAADTGKPIAHAIVASIGEELVETDRDGRFRAKAESSDHHFVQVLAPEGQPYLNVRTAEFAWPKGALEHRIDLTLPRGIVIRGRVTEEGSGQPIAGTMLGYLAGSPADALEPWFGNAWAGPDGSFQLAVSPKSTHLIARGPSEDYVLQVTSERLIEEGQPGGRRIYAHAFIAYDRKSGEDTRVVEVALRRGMTVKGQVIGPDGQPVQDVQMISPIFLMQSGVPWRSWQGNYHGNARNGLFELHGLATDAEIPVFFLEPKRKLGAMVNISGKSGSGGPITVRLESCGTARARLVDPAGKPLAGYHDPYIIGMVVTPGPPWYSRDKADESRLAGERDYVCRLDPINYPDGCVSDAQGRVIFPALIPGATYQIDDMSAIDDDGGGHRRKEFTVKPGETVNLGDILIEKPEE
jgi:RNA polymerase sigma factor (sigma-70 family)